MLSKVVNCLHNGIMILNEVECFVWGPASLEDMQNRLVPKCARVRYLVVLKGILNGLLGNKKNLVLLNCLH